MTTQLNIAQAIALSLEELQAMNAGQLAELHSTLSTSKQKAATRRADLIAGIIRGKKKAPDASEQLELVPVENSVKPKPSRKPKAGAKTAGAALVDALKESDAEEAKAEGTPKPSRKPKAQAGTKKDAPAVDPREPVAEEKAPEPKKTLKRKSAAKPDIDKMSAAELKKLAAELVEKTENGDFAPVIQGDKISYKRLDGFDTVLDIQKYIVANPLRLYMFVDEKIDDDLTQFVVLYANENVIVLHDRNRSIDSTMTAQMKNMDADTIKFDKVKFKYSFYERVATAKK